MAKQVVIETRSNSSKVRFVGLDENGKKVFRPAASGKPVDVSYHYNFDPDLVGKKEREEVVVGNITKYWVRVPDTVVGITQSWSDKQEIIANRRKAKAANKKAAWDKLQDEKWARIARYAEMAKKGELFQGSLQPTPEDIASAVKLQKMSKRAQNKTVGSLV